MSAQSAAKLVGVGDLQSPEAASPLAPPAVLQELVEKFRVNWVLLPETMFIFDGKHQLGFVLELRGRHQGAGRLARDCERCRRVSTALRLIADWVLPCGKECSVCDVRIITPFVTGTSACAKRAAVTLTVRVFRATGDGTDFSCRPECLAWAEARLRELKATQLRTEDLGAL